MPVYFIQSAQITEQKIEITGELAHHLRDVLRFGIGEIFDVVDENQRRYRISLDDITPQRLLARILTMEDKPSAPPLELHLVQALLKKPKMDWVVQKATELGVAHFLPLVTERTVVRLHTDRSKHQQDRWQKIAQEAAQQCGRTDVPQVHLPTDLKSLCDHPPKVDLKLIFWEQERERPLRSVLSHHQPLRSLLLLIGPEGGFSRAELDLARSADFITASLGQRILRAETASLAALAILQYELGDMR